MGSYAEDQLLRMALKDLEKGGWTVDYLESSGSRLWYPRPELRGVLITFTLNPDHHSLDLSFLAEAEYHLNETTRSFFSLLSKSLLERGIEFEWKEPHSFVVLWTVRDANLSLYRGVVALTTELTEQVEEGKCMVNSCMRALTLCEPIPSRRETDYVKTASTRLLPLVAFVDERECVHSSMH